jgi:hypothetical protein
MRDSFGNIAAEVLLSIHMTPAAVLAQMIEELPPEDKEKVEEYIYLLHGKDQIVPETELDKKYREYILQGIAEGEAAYERGEYLESAEARQYLLERMK